MNDIERLKLLKEVEEELHSIPDCLRIVSGKGVGAPREDVKPLTKKQYNRGK